MLLQAKAVLLVLKAMGGHHQSSKDVMKRAPGCMTLLQGGCGLEMRSGMGRIRERT